jgi:hypothetical protein
MRMMFSMNLAELDQKAEGFTQRRKEFAEAQRSFCGIKYKLSVFAVK